MKGDRKIKSLGKTISWRIIATLTTISLIYIFTKEITLALGIGGIEIIAKMILYYIHERVWNKIK